MHEHARAALQQDDALTELNVNLAKLWGGVERLSSGEIAARFPDRVLTAAWRIPAEALGSSGDVLLLCDELYPYSLPLVALVTAPAPGSLPHVGSATASSA